jgi:hypothetical protein
MTITNYAAYAWERRYVFRQTSVGATAPAALDNTCPQFDVKSSNLKVTDEIVDAMGAYGDRSRKQFRIRHGIQRVAGSMTFDLSFKILDFFMPAISGTAATPYIPALNLLPFDMCQSTFTGTDTNAEMFTEMYVSRARINFRPGPLELELDVVGKAYGTQTFPSAPVMGITEEYQPMVFYDFANGLNFNDQSSFTPNFERATLTVDNRCDQKFRNNRTAVSIRPQGRIVTLDLDLPLTSSAWSTLWGDKLALGRITLTAARDNLGTVITLYNVVAPDTGIEQPMTGEMPFHLRYEARSDNTNPEFNWTVDSTP